jgi:hypothetical protein
MEEKDEERGQLLLWEKITRAEIWKLDKGGYERDRVAQVDPHEG